MQSRTPHSSVSTNSAANGGAIYPAQTLLKSFRWALSTNWFLYLLAALLVGSSLLTSLHTDAWHWFQRSGALMVAIGALLSTRQPLGLLLDGMIAGAAIKDSVGSDVEPAEMNAIELQTCVCGFLFVAMGTLIWAYGDLLGCLLYWNSSCLGA